MVCTWYFAQYYTDYSTRNYWIECFSCLFFYVCFYSSGGQKTFAGQFGGRVGRGGREGKRGSYKDGPVRNMLLGLNRSRRVKMIKRLARKSFPSKIFQLLILSSISPLDFRHFFECEKSHKNEEIKFSIKKSQPEKVFHRPSSSLRFLKNSVPSFFLFMFVPSSKMFTIHFSQSIIID